MSVIAAALKHMLASNMPHDAILAAVEDMERGLQTDEQAERRRAADRDRQRERRLRISAESADKPDSPRVGVAHVEDNLLPSEIEPQVKEEKKARRASRLSANWVLPVEWRDDGRKAGLSEAQIDAEAVTMLDWSLSSPNGSKLDWRASWRTWCRRAASDAQRPRAGPRSPRQAPIDHFRTYASEINGQDGNDRSIGGDWDDAPGLPVRTIEHHG